MSKEQCPCQQRISKRDFIVKRIVGPLVGTIAGMLAVTIFLVLNAQGWNPELAKAVIIGGAVAMVGGLFLMVKEIIQATVESFVEEWD